MVGARAEVTINQPADAVWGSIGDFGNVNWIPNVTLVQLHDDIRVFQLGGSIVKHRLVRRDDAARSYTYALAGDVTTESAEVAHVTEATILVVADGATASTVVWSSETEERRGSSEGLRAFFQGILDHLKKELEHP